MTATYPARQKAAYRGVVYGIDVLDHHSRQIVRNDYVGQTRQRGRARENQHRDDKPWSDMIVGSPNILWEGVCTDDQLDEMERRFIQDVEQRPRLNWLLNEDNPHHIPKWVQTEQRHARDDAAGRPCWQPLKERSGASLLEWQTPVPARVRVRPVPALRWRPWEKRVVGWGSGWAGTALAGWIAELYYHLGGWKQTGITAAAGSLLLMVWLMCGAPIPVGKWKRRARNLRRRLWR